MLTEQPTKRFVPLQKYNLGRGWCRKTGFSPQVIHYCPFQGGSSVVVLCCLDLCQSFSDVSPYVRSYYFSSVRVAE